MNYPAWVVPVIGSGWVIGIIAIIHMVLSHFAVGGGFYLPIMERKARREGREDWLKVLKRHSKFFLIITAVFGAITGVGIWFAIGLASSEATSTLIHNFVLAWAAEWAFFIIEVTSIIVYYYTWDKVSTKAHMAVGWIYAVSAWMSLFIINGILTFMLDPGTDWLAVAGTGEESSAFWSAFFNPTYWPSLLIRTLICIVLAGLFALVTASRIDKEKKPDLKIAVVHWSSKWLIPSFILMPFAFAWYIFSMPEANRALFKIGVSTIGQGIFTQLTRNGVIIIVASAAVFAAVYFFAFKNARNFTLWQAITILILGLAVTGATEHAREMLRKPYVVGGHLYSNGVRVNEVDKFNSDGYLTEAIWATPTEKEAWVKNDELLFNSNSEIETNTFDTAAHYRRGELMVRGQCMACHTLDRKGYRSLYDLLNGRNRESIENFVNLLHEYPEDSNYRAFMPPLVGTKGEIRSIMDYLARLVDIWEAQAGFPSSVGAAEGD